MSKAILVSIYSHNPFAEGFDSYEEAVEKMKKEFYNEIRQPFGSSYDEAYAGLDAENGKAWVDGIGTSDCPLNWAVFDVDNLSG